MFDHTLFAANRTNFGATVAQGSVRLRLEFGSNARAPYSRETYVVEVRIVDNTYSRRRLRGFRGLFPGADRNILAARGGLRARGARQGCGLRGHSARQIAA